MANPPKKGVRKPVQSKAKTDAVALTAAQALKAVEASYAPSTPETRKYARKAPVRAAKPVIETAPEAVTPVEPVAAEGFEKPNVAVDVPKEDAPVTILKTIEAKNEEEAAPDAVAPAIPTFAASAEGTKTMNDVIENSKKYTEEAKARFQSAYSDISAKAKAGVEKSTKAIEELSDITKGNVEALVESGKIAAKGVEALGQDAAEYSRLSFEKATATLKSLAAVKTPTEYFQLQSELLSSAFDGFAKEAAKNSEALLKLAGDVAQPISSRVAVVTDKVKSLAA